ncbi:protein O-GlcNAc transferase [Gammaproteobacteria bacterium]
MSKTRHAREIEQRFREAFQRHEKGDLTGAEVLYKKILTSRPDHDQVLYLLGTLESQRGNHSTAHGYLSRALALRPNWPEALNNLGLVSLTLGQLGDAESLLRRALALHPDYADALNNLAGVLEQQGQTEDAMELYQRTVKLRPNSANVHYNLGLLLKRLTRLEEAVLSFERALAVDPTHFEACNTLATILKTLDRLEDAEHWLHRALALYPDFHDAHNNLAAVFQSQDRLEEAMEEYGRALALRPNEPLVQWNRAFILLALGHLVEGWEAYEWRRPVFHWQTLPFPEWDGGDLTGKTLLVFAEQGLGDELLFASCFPDLVARAGHCLFECDPRLATLYRRSFPTATIVGVKRTDRTWIQTLPQIDVQIPAGSLARRLRPTIESFPNQPGYLIADPVASDRWRTRLAALGPGLKVGITWRSGLMREGRHRNYSRLNEWGAVFAVPGVHFINLQYDDCTEERAVVRRLFGVEIHAFPEVDLFNDLEGTAALTSTLDMVIAAGNAAGEIAAALGVPVWRLESHGRPWTSLGTEVFPWHPRMRVFRQEVRGEWGKVLEQVATALAIAVGPSTLNALTPIPLPEGERLGSLPSPSGRETTLTPTPLPEGEGLFREEDGPLSYLKAGNQAWAANRLAEAERHYRQALALDPDLPEAHNNLGSLLFDTGRVVEAEQNYRTALTHRADFPEAHYNLANVLYQQGQSAASLVEYRAALALRPDYAEAHNNLGRTLQEMGQWAEAEETLNRALTLAPELPEAHHNLGTLRHNQDRLEEAVACYQHALALRPTFASALYNLANVLRELGRVDDAEPYARRAVALAPHDSKAAIILGDVLQDQDRFSEALSCYHRALPPSNEPTTDYTEAQRNRAFCLLAAGDLTQGWTAYAARRSLLPPLPLAGPEWSGNDALTGKTVLVLAEQGLGDELLFASCLPNLIAIAGHCVVECAPRLVSLYARSFPTATVQPSGTFLPSPAEGGTEGEGPLQCPTPDFQVRIGDLPRYLRPTLDRFPDTRGYLIPDPVRVTAWRERLTALGTGFKVGITWRSGLLKAARRRHYTELNQWTPVLSVPGVTFVNLQYDDCAAELSTVRKRYGVEIHTFPGLNLKDDLEEAAALSSALDLVIGVGNAATELAATLGLSVWRLEACGRSWTSLGTAAMPWHPAVRLFKQPRWGDWGSVFATLATQLSEFTSSTSSTVLKTEVEKHTETRDLTAAREHLRTGRPAQARKSCRAHLTRHPDDHVALDLLAAAANADGAREEALAALQRAVVIAPHAALYHGHLANALAMAGRSDAAEAAYRSALRLDPHWSQAHNDLGNLLRTEGRMEEAERCYLSALRYKSDLVEAHNNLGTVLELQGRIAEAEAAYRGALRLRPYFPEGWYNLGNCLGDLGRWTEAEAAYREALTLRPDYAQAQFYLGTALVRLGQPEAAEAAYRQALVLRPTWAEALNMLANLLVEQGRWSEAETIYRAALTITPESPELHSNLGNCLQIQGRPIEAETACREAIRLAPNFATAWNNLGNALRALGRPAEGQAAFREALTRDPTLADAHSNLGNALREAGVLSDAEIHDRRAVALRPDLAGAWLNLGNTLQAAERMEEAENCFQCALTLGLEDAVLSLGKIRYEQGRPDAAAECLAKGIQRHPDNPEMRWNLALPLLALGNLEEGWAAYEWGRQLPGKNARREGFHHFLEWDGSPLAGKTILVYAEQGVGDEILFASCLPDLLTKVGHCIIECDRRLATLYTRSFPTATVVGENRSEQGWVTELVETKAVDVEIPIGSLPRFLRKRLTDFPDRTTYLIPDPIQVEKWRARLAEPGIKVGITWRSRLTTGTRSRHYSRLEDWGAILALPGIRFVNLQYDDCVEELATVQKRFGIEVLTFPELDLMNDLEGAAALSANLDLIIAAGNAAGEIAAAIGRPVWRLEASGRHWTSLGTTLFPWHPRMRIFRQSQPGNWSEVLGRIATALKTLTLGTDHALLQSFTLQEQEKVAAMLISDSYQRGLELQEKDELDEAAACYQEALRLDPGRAEAHNNLGNMHLKRGDLTAAETCYRQALGLRPNSVEAWNNLGVLLGKRRQNHEATLCYQTALDLRPDLFETRYNLANLLQEEGDPVAAEEHFRKALQQGVDTALLWNGLALAIRDQGRMEEALSCFAEAQLRDPNDVRIQWNIGLTHLIQGDLMRGWEGYECGYHAMRRTTRGFEFPDWDGRYAPEATLLIYAEQGVGDEILFASCIPDLLQRVGRCVIECDSRLGTLMARSFPRVEVHGVPREDREWLMEIGHIDFQCPIGSLAYYLRRHLDSFPRRPGYFLPDPVQRVAWRKRLAELDTPFTVGKNNLGAEPKRTFKVGISWRSRLVGGGRARFYSRLLQWEALFAISGVVFVNLQYDDCTAELAEVRTRFGVEIVQFPDVDLLNNLDGVAALIGALDLVIAPPNTVAEIAAAIGTEVWRLDADLPSWPMLGTKVMPWHPTMRLFRQKQLGDWEEVLKTVAETLTKRVTLATVNPRVDAAPIFQFPHPEINKIGKRIGQLLAQLVTPGALVMRIGSGSDYSITQTLNQAVGKTGWVIVFEERAGPFLRLQANVLRHGMDRVLCRQEQIGDQVRELPAWQACPWELSISGDQESNLPLATAPISCCTIDSLDLPACDLLVIDSEGRETEILAGAWQTLTRYRPLLSLGRYRHEASASLIALLETRGYRSLAQEIEEREIVLLAYPMV